MMGGQGGTFASGLLGRIGSPLFGGQNKALENQAKAYKTAYEGSVPFYDQARGRFNPYAEQGLAANPLISSLLGMSEGDSSGGEGLARFRESTGYQDTLNQSLRGVGANAAARGLMGSSGSGRAFQETAGRLAQRCAVSSLRRLDSRASLPNAVSARCESSARVLGPLFDINTRYLPESVGCSLF